MTQNVDNTPTDEESAAFEELCDRNGIDMARSTSNRFAIKKLEMFFDGYPKIVGLHYFPFLVEVAILGQNISKIENLTGLSHLRELWLADCKITSIENLDDLHNLEKLFLHGNKISEIKNLGHLEMLKVLWLARNQINKVENLSQNTLLTELNLAENLIDSIGHSLDKNSRLEMLNLSGNPLISFKEFSNFSRLNHLKSLYLRDPTYKAAPIAENINYSTQIMFYLPSLEFLDGNEIKSRPMQELASSTVRRKKAFYDMRLNGIERTFDDVSIKLSMVVQKMMDKIQKNVGNLVLCKKELQCFLQHDLSKGAINSASKSQKDDDRFLPCRSCEVSGIYEKEYHHSKENVSSLSRSKLSHIESAIGRAERTISSIRSSELAVATQLDKLKNLWHKFLRIELETAGNIFIEFGTEKDHWFNHCKQLVLSRFCYTDFSEQGISEVKIHGIARISNRYQRTRFELKLESAIVDKHEHLWQLTMLEIARRANIEYLFYIPLNDNSESDRTSEVTEIIDQGFKTRLENQMNAIPLTNSLYRADEHIFPHSSNLGISSPLKENLRFGQALLCKTFCGKSQFQENDGNRVSYGTLPGYDSIVRTCTPPSAESGNSTCPDCQNRIQEWFVFDQERVLPEYIVFYEYDSLKFPMNPFTNVVGAAIAQSHAKSSLKVSKLVISEEAYSMESDLDLIAIDPTFEYKLSLNGEDIINEISSRSYHKLTRLCLYKSSLSNIPTLKYFINLKDLDLSLNRISNFTVENELGDVLNSLENLDISHNELDSFETAPFFTRLKTLNANWNLLTDLNVTLGQLRRQMPMLVVISARNNPWFRPKSIRLRFIAAFKSSVMVDGVQITESERSEASKMVASASLSNAEVITPMLIAKGRTDYSLPNSIALGSSCHHVLAASNLKPKPYAEVQNLTWIENITTLVLENQGLTKLHGIERLKFLKWASFRDNFITSLHGVDSCRALVELILDNNCIINVDILNSLPHITTLSLNNNRIKKIEWKHPDRLESLSHLSVNGNLISSLSYIQQLPCLQNIFLANNQIENIREVFLLKNLETLFALDLFGNGVCTGSNYRLSVIYHLPTLKILDSLPIEVTETTSARDFFGGKLSEDFVLDRLGHGPGTDLVAIAELDLPNCNLYTIDISPSSLPNLRSLNLENNNLSNIGSLSTSQSLQVLCLNNNHIESMVAPGKGKAHLYATKSKIDTGLGNQNYLQNSEIDLSPVLPKLEVLYLAGNAIRSLTALQINRIPSLVTLFLHNNEISTIEGLECLTNLRDLVLDRNRVKVLNENSFMGQSRLVELHMEENRLRDLTYFNSLRSLRRLYLGGNKLQMASELDKLQDLRKLHEISLVNNPLTRKNIHRAVILYYIPHLKLIDGMPISVEDTEKAQMLANQEEGSSFMGGAALMPTAMGSNSVINSNSASSSLLPVHVYQPIGLPGQHSVSTGGNQQYLGTNLLYYPGQASLLQQPLGSYVLQSNSQPHMQPNPQMKVANLQLSIAKPGADEAAQSNNVFPVPHMPGNSGIQPGINPVVESWIARRLRTNAAQQPQPQSSSAYQMLANKQQFIPSESIGASSQQQQDAVTKIHGNKLNRH